MQPIVIPAESLTLPDIFAIKLRGKMVALTERENIISISPIKSPIEEAYGMFESDGHEVDRFLSRQRLEKELEYV